MEAGGKRGGRRIKNLSRSRLWTIRSDLYRRRTLLGNGDDGRRCRDAHKEGQTIEEKQKVSPGSWPHKIQVESGSIELIPASRGHNYANDLPPPASWFPPVFFFCNPPQRPTNNIQRPASSHPTLNVHHISLLRRLHLSRLATIIFILYSCGL